MIFPRASEELIYVKHATRVPGMCAIDQEQRDLLLRALEAAANAIYVTDRSGHILWVNEAFCRQSGYQRHESVGQNPRLLNSGIQAPEVYRAMWETIISARPWQGELVDRRSDGSLYTVDQVITPLVDSNSTVTHFVAIQHDVNEAARERDDIRKLAYYDSLTGLPNRVLILELLTQAIGHADTRRQMLAVMFLDLDHCALQEARKGARGGGGPQRASRRRRARSARRRFGSGRG